MKKAYFFLWAAVFLFCLPMVGRAQVAIDETHFPDSVFREYVKTNFDTDGDGTLSEEECGAVRDISVCGCDSNRSPLADLTGIEYFPGLFFLYCCYTSLTSLDVSQNPALIFLNCSHTGITSLDVSQNPALTDLDCSHTCLTSLDVSQNPALEYLDCSHTDITSLDVSQNPALEYLDCSHTDITSLDVSQNPALIFLNCFHTEITSLDVTLNPKLRGLDCSNTGITSLDVTHNPNLDVFRCYNLEITDIDVSKNPTLFELNCSHTGIASLDVSHNPELLYLYCFNTELTSLDLNQNQKIWDFDCSKSRCEVAGEIGGTYDLSRLPGFDVSRASDWKGGSVQGSVLTFNDTAVTYRYATLYAGESEEVPATLEFKLVANPDAEDDAGLSPHPSAVPFAAYAREGSLYLQGIRGMVEVFDLQGRRIYRGTANPVALPSQGVYIVRNQGSSLKVPNL